MWQSVVNASIGPRALFHATSGRGTGTTHGSLESSGNLSWKVIGGYGASVSNDNVGSIINFRCTPSAWRPVDYRKPKGIMSFLPPHLHEHCRNKFGHLIAFEYHYPDVGRYEGTFRKGTAIREGAGKMTYSNLEVYCGQWYDSLRHGRGRLTKIDGNVEDGLWFYDYLSLNTVVDEFIADGKYSGGLQDGVPHGGGICHYDDGAVYKGGFSQGKKNGHGVCSWPSGSVYAFDFFSSLRSGERVMKNHCKYQGEWKHDAQHGHGIYTWANGDVYTGSYVNDQRSGNGVLVLVDGQKYDGEWRNSKKNGHGVHIWANGDVYTGNWVDEQRSGKGVMVTASSGARVEGEWFEDKIVSK